MSRRPAPPPRLAALALAALAALAVLGAPGARAERADRFKPTNVEADRMQYDDLKQVNVFSGSVVLTKGTITLRGDRLVLRQDPEGYQHGTATGRLASFRQKRDGVDEWVEGYAEEIVYDGKLETVTLTGRARVRRLEGTRVVDEIDGAVIVYDGRTEQFSVDGGTASGPASAVGGRVRVTIQPRLGDAGSAAPVPGGGAALRPSAPSPATSAPAGASPAPTPPAPSSRAPEPRR